MVRDDTEQQRFELEIDGHLAFAAYRREGSTVTFTHTEVPEIFRGKGVGSRLAKGALDLVRARGDRVIARCAFIAAFIEGHPEYQDLLV